MMLIILVLYNGDRIHVEIERTRDTAQLIKAASYIAYMHKKS